MSRRQVLLTCSFCGKNQHQVHRLIGGPNGVAICSQCIDLCNQIVTEENQSQPPQQTGMEAHGTPHPEHKP